MDRRFGIFLALGALLTCGACSESSDGAGSDALGSDGDANPTGGDVRRADGSPSVGAANTDGAGSSNDVAEIDDAGPSAIDEPDGPLRVTPRRLDFGLVDCGGRAAAQTLSFSNDSGSALTWTASLDKGEGSPFALAPTGGALAPGGTVVLTITPKAVPAISAVTPNGLGDGISIASDLPGVPPRIVRLAQTARGAVLTFSPRTLDFSGVPLTAGPSTNRVGLVNGGNVPATVALGLGEGTPFALASPERQAVGPQSIKSIDVAFTPVDTIPARGSVTMTLAEKTPLCGPLPPPLTLLGQGTNASVVVTSRVSFGKDGMVDCGRVAEPGLVMVQNRGNGPVDFTATLGKTGAAATFVVTPTTGTVNAGNTATLTVAPRPFPSPATMLPNFYGDTMTITTNAFGDVPHAVNLELGARGLLLTRSTNAITFPGVAVGTTNGATFTLTNTGNVGASVSMSTANPDFIVGTPITLTSEMSSANVTVRFTPSASGSASDLAFTTVGNDVPLCGPLPAPLMLSGSGMPSSLIASTGPLSFGFTACGAQATPQTVTITNNGRATTFSTALEKGTTSPFSVAPASGPITAGGSVTITVTAMAIPTLAPTSANGFGDVLRVSSANGNVSVMLNQTAAGAVLSFRDPLGAGLGSLAFGTVGAGAKAAKNMRIRNEGNAAANFTIAVDGADRNYAVTPSTGSATAGTTTSDHTVTFQPQSTGAKPQTLSISADGLCAPLPPPLVLSGTGG